ncbi:helix-hairpin-helix domain-containing protein [Nostoc ellipsosporum NOK]|nr:helix-hairpin-helix domain-containing protein [Nostoc ellipsosporum NOK]
MDAAERRDRIVEYLRIKPISHGQIYTFQIAIPQSEIVEIPLERHEQIKNSLTQQGSNLIPLIVRRTEAYSEEEEYEVVYGADWCLIAKKLGIEKLWVWVFDMTDEQAAAAKEEMQQLLGFSNSTPVILPSDSKETESNKTILDKFFQQLTTLNQKFEQLASSVQKRDNPDSYKTDIDNKVEILIQKVEFLSQKIEQPIVYDKKLEERQTKQAMAPNETEIYSKQIEELIQAVRRIETFIHNLPKSDGENVIANNKINLNAIKSPEQLAKYKIPQLGEKTAKAIIKLRQDKGKFQSLSELLEIKGITPIKLKIIDNYLFCE